MKDVITRAEEEIHIFERASLATTKALVDELKKTTAENARLQSIIDEFNSGSDKFAEPESEPCILKEYNHAAITPIDFGAIPDSVPAPQSPTDWNEDDDDSANLAYMLGIKSPALEVPDDWNAQCTCGHRWRAVMPTENCPSCNPSPRITEQDAERIYFDAVEHYKYTNSQNSTAWLHMSGRALLTKLNEAKNGA